MRKVIFVVVMMLLLPTADLVAQKPNQKSTNVVFIDGNDYYLHTVRQGETLYSLGKLYGLPVPRIEEDNPALQNQQIREGQVLKIICTQVPAPPKMSARRMARIFAEHVVVQGETTYSIARRYGLSVNTLIEDNPGLDPAVLAIGQVVKIRKKEMGETSQQQIAEQIEDYAQVLNEVSEDNIYYVVKKGDTVYSLLKTFGITQQELEGQNNLEGGLKAESMIKIPVNDRNRDLANRMRAIAGQPHVVENVHRLDSMNAGGFLVEDPHLYRSDSIPVFRGDLKEYTYRGRMNISLLLPLSTDGPPNHQNANFVDFYKGVLLALEDFKAAGFSLTLNLFDTHRSKQEVERIARSREFMASDLVIGPVYEDEMLPAVVAAQQKRIPLVSPLANIEGAYGSVMYQLAPDPATKYDKLRSKLEEDKNIVVVSTEEVDTEFEREITTLLEGLEFQRFVYQREGKRGTQMLETAIDPTKENVFIVLSGSEFGVELVLASISSLYNNRQARSVKTGPVQVIGNAKWLRYPNIERNLFFKLNVSFMTSYHADRTDSKVSQFDRRYIAAFDQTPSLYSYRGYDAIRLFGEAMILAQGSTLNEKLGAVIPPLQVDYDIRQLPDGNNVNQNWVMVNYKSNYTIEVQ